MMGNKIMLVFPIILSLMILLDSWFSATLGCTRRRRVGLLTRWPSCDAASRVVDGEPVRGSATILSGEWRVEFCRGCTCRSAMASRGPRSGERSYGRQSQTPIHFQMLGYWISGPAFCEVTCRGAIPPNLRPILERLGLQSESWIDCVDNFGRWFHRAAGHVSLLSDAAARAGRQWFHGVSRCRQAFA